MNRNWAALNGARRGTCDQNLDRSFVEIYEEQLAVDAARKRDAYFVTRVLVVSILFLGLAGIIALAMPVKPSAMEVCQQKASFETCFHTLNR